MDTGYQFFPGLFLRAPYYSFARYDLDRMPEVLRERAFQNALFLASPGFYAQLEAKDFTYDKLLDKEKHTLDKYYNRMCFRPTPFGGFASFTTLEWGSGAVSLGADEKTRMHLHPDQALIAALNARLFTGLRDRLLMVNPTLYRFGKEFRFIKSVQDAKGRNTYTIDSLSAAPFYVRLIAQFKKGDISSARLSDWIVSELNCDVGEAEAYVTFLVDEKVLLGPETGTVILSGDHQSLHQFPGWKAQEIARDAPVQKDRVAERAGEMIMGYNLKETIKQPFYAALERPLESGGPNEDDRQELGMAVRMLQKLALPVRLPDLEKFTREFESRFDMAKVPLLEALDPDAGINFGSLTGSITTGEVLSDLPFPPSNGKNERIDWTPLHGKLLKLWRGIGRDFFAPLVLGEHFFDVGEMHEAIFPPTISVMYRRAEDHLVLENAGGITAASLIGRFTLFSEEVLAMAREIAQYEETAHPGIAFADIAQLSDIHVDNINRRCRIYSYEIPINVYTDGRPAERICLDDLYLSVSRGKLILESKRLGMRVVPRLTSAYNHYHNELAVFRLLCDLQFQEVTTNPGFDLEHFFPDMDFYPRVCYRQVILCCARWRFKEVDLLSLQDGDSWSKLLQFRKHHHLPQRVSIGAGDQQLVFDLSNRKEGDFFIRCLAGLQQVTITEYLLPDRSVKNGHKPLAAQYVAFLHRDRPVYTVPIPTVFPGKTKVARRHTFGSDWLYLKIYCTSESADEILAAAIRPFLIKNRKQIRQWFFIRYRDPGYHIRLRILMEKKALGNLLNCLKKQFQTGDRELLIRDLYGHTYLRELERYGHDLIEAVESHFCASSDLVAWSLVQRRQGRLFLSEFQLAFMTVYHMLGIFIQDWSRINIFCSSMAEGFLAEFKEGKSLRTGMDKKYRIYKVELVGLAEMSGDMLGREAAILFNRFSDQNSVVTAAVKHRSPEQRTSLFADLVHMHLNRLFRDNQREHEMLVYYCLHKYLVSKIATKEKGQVC